MRLYHGTLRKNLMRILRQGLEPRCGRLNKMVEEDTGSKIRCVSLSHDFFEAVLWANRKRANSHDGIRHMQSAEIPIVIEVEVPRLNLHHLLEKTNDGIIRNYSLTERIPPEKIVGFKEVPVFTIERTAKFLGKNIRDRWV